jgi:hypothetical protein
MLEPNAVQSRPQQAGNTNWLYAMLARLQKRKSALKGDTGG